MTEMGDWEVHTDLTFVDGKKKAGVVYRGLDFQMREGDRLELRFWEGEEYEEFAGLREGWYAVSDSDVHCLHSRSASFTRRYTLERMDPQPE